MTLSIIVPIKNGDKYLKKCIDSILAQSLTDFELILVNDASTDKSKEIIDYYVQADNRVIALETEDVKVNKVRQIGLSKAQGDYVGFVDCDDWIDPNMYKELVEYCIDNDLDIVSSGMIREHVERGFREDFNDNIEEGIYRDHEMREKIYPYMLSKSPFFTHGIQPSIWNKVFRKNILDETFEDLDMEIIYGEDATVVYKALLKANSVGLIKKGYYHYRIHSDSSIYVHKEDFYYNLPRLYKQLKTIFENDQQSSVLLKQLQYFVIVTDFFNLKRTFEIDLYSMMDWFMPFGEYITNNSIAIYGAGDVGKSFFNDISSRASAKDIIWVDSNYQKLSLDNKSVQAPEKLKEQKVDYVIIAIRDRNVAKEIRANLLELGYEDERILWQLYNRKFTFL